MKLSKYLKTNFLIILLFIIIIAIINLMLISFKSDKQAIIGINAITIIGFILYIVYDFSRRKKFYDKFLNDLDLLDKKYLITEMINKPNFYDGEILYDALYEIDKSMAEKIKEYSLNIQDFKEYIEMWIHEVKLPLASINLMIHNHKELSDKKIIEQLKRIDDDVEQVLYYVRSENAEKDYLIKETELNKVIGNVAMKNKDILLENKIDFIVDVGDKKVLTYSKWLEFIINKIVSNSIKYIRSDVEHFIKITAEENNKNTILKIYDNGIGIEKSDISKVFNKTFTGNNGRKIETSTGMGLYITKQLCKKLGHKITIESKENEFTEISLIFNKNDFYNVRTKGAWKRNFNILVSDMLCYLFVCQNHIVILCTILGKSYWLPNIEN